MSNPQLKLKKAQPERLRSLGLDEPWLQNEIAHDTSLLDLGELELTKKEKIQAAGGRIDFLMRDPESETRYEIEVMLGEVDESHIIRTIEYWDVERQRYPDLVHYAVIVAEEITARFFNVIRLLNRAVPIIAIQLSAFRIGDEVVLQFVRVLDVPEPPDPADEEAAEPADRAYWERKSNPESMAVLDAIKGLTPTKRGEPKITYNKHHIALGTSGYNFCWMHLRTDPSLSTGEVFGRRFPALFMLDQSWAKDNVELIFKPEAKQLERVAWINYLLCCQAFDELLPLLMSQYEKAIDSTAAPLDASVKDEFERSLVRHLIGFFWRGRLNLDDEKGLLARFFEKAPLKLKAYAFEIIGRSLGNAPLKEGDSQNLLERLRELLANRLNSIKQSGIDACELEPFGWWFISNQFDPDWLMQNLLAVLRACHKISPDWRVVECLAQDVKSRPVQSVEALEQIIIGDREGWLIHGWEQHARELLKAALDSDSAEARESAVRVINLIGSRGQYGFPDLLRTQKAQ